MGSGESGYSRSPCRRNAARLVTRACTSGAACKSSLTRGAAGSRCSKLSSTSSSCRVLSRRRTASIREMLPWSVSSRAAATAGHDLRGILQRRQIDKDDAIAKGIAQIRRDRHGETRLAHPARPGHGEQADPLVAQQSRDLAALHVTANQPRERPGEACLTGRGRGLPFRREGATGRRQQGRPLAFR